jgi:hypothetical protein
MKKFYSGKFTINFLIRTQSLNNKAVKYRSPIFALVAIIFCLFQTFLPLNSFSQKLELSYSYFNLTRNSGGGTLENGDIIEIHSLAKANATINNLYYIDTIPAGTQFVSGSLKLMTNEGLSFTGSGPYTDATNDDAGVYNSTANAVRINIPGNGTGFTYARNGANFGLATGGGTVVNGTTLPKFYGNTLFIVSYQLLVTATNGDTIHPTGNFYFDTSGVTKSYRFNYAGIKVIQNQALCTNFSSATFTAESSFGSGSTQNRTLGVNAPGYVKKTLDVNNPGDNYYSIVNNTSANGTTNNAGPFKPTTNNARVFGGFWDIIGDHTGASNTADGNLPVAAGQPGGYMLVVNAAFTTGEVYRDTIKNVCPNTYYEFSAWVRNICGVCGIDKNSAATYTPGVYPNLSYTINDVDYYTTGNISHDNIWQKRGFIYKTGPTETQFRITIKNNAAGGGGNDWVLDDIKLATCYPNLVNSPKDTATSCSGAYLSLSDTVKSYFNNYTNFCWEKSLDGTNWMSTGVCGSKLPTIVNGLYQYVVDTTFKTVKADSGTYYRLKVGTTFSNLNDPNCSVGNSQKIFVKVFNVNCTLLDTKLLTFSGSMLNDQTLLRWSSQNEGDLKEYEIEKSLDGIKFYKTGIVAGINDDNGAGYSFVDAEPLSSVAYYRLKLVSGSNTGDKYSKIIVLYNKNASFKITLVNPFKTNIKGDIFLPGDGDVILTHYDVYGKAVSRKNIRLSKVTSHFIIDGVQRLSSGIYILSTQFNNTIIQNKLFKIN